MRATDLIRSVLCVIDAIDQPQVPASASIQVQVPVEEPANEIPGDPKQELEPGFRQIFDILSARTTGQYSNSPTEHIAGIQSVTTDAGTEGWNGSKDPADLRVKDPSMYPTAQHGVK